MSYLAHQKDFGPYLDTCPAPIGCGVARLDKTEPDKTSLFRRLADMLFEPRHKQLDREMGTYLLSSGGRLTDSLEREMMAHLTRSNWARR